jgi:hypothetical protein
MASARIAGVVPSHHPALTSTSTFQIAAFLRRTAASNNGGPMRNPVLIEEIRLEFFVSRDLPEEQALAVHQTLDSKLFRTRLGRAVRAMVQEFESLQPVQIRITR